GARMRADERQPYRFVYAPLADRSFIYSMLPPPPKSTLFPYTTLFRSFITLLKANFTNPDAITDTELSRATVEGLLVRLPRGITLDRKSTRLNSSHLVISYAVFCLKKKKKDQTHQ